MKRNRYRSTASGAMDLYPDIAILYRIYDRNDTLLYVGITESLTQRIGQHLSTAAWAVWAVRVEWDAYPTRRQAAHEEGRAIKNLRPIYNIFGNCDWEGPTPLGPVVAELHKSNRQLASGE